MLVKQTKTTTKPLFDPDYYTVTEVRGTKITGERRGKSKTRNMEKWKVYKERPAHLSITRLPEKEEEREEDSDSDFDFDLRSEHDPQDRGEQHGATAA